MKNAGYVRWESNLQMGYVFKSNWEISGRYAHITPETNSLNRKIEDLTLGLSKYIIEHNFKIQFDFTYRQTQGVADTYIARLQMEFQF